MIYRSIIYALFFMSGLSALIYQVLWVRSFSLIFGGSHLAVTTVLSVFMAGLALGGYLGKHTDRSPSPLRIYGFLEIGIGGAAILLLGLLQIYPDLYIAFAHLVNNDPAALNLGRVFFAVLALLPATTLMGLTLPALAGFTTRNGGQLGRHLSLLYGINTFGAVAGALAAGFFLLQHLTMTATYALAIIISLLVGVVSLLIDNRSGVTEPAPKKEDSSAETPGSSDKDATASGAQQILPIRLILFGIGISGFCALGYEVLWTRVLSLVVGTTVYGYTLMLVAFLVGIALGGSSYRLLLYFFKARSISRSVLLFGLVQVVIGFFALLVTYALRDLTNQSLVVENWLQQWLGQDSAVLTTSSFIVALVYMLVPAFFMGLAFPLAGDLVALGGRKTGRAVGITLTYNTAGAILGAAVSGYLLIYLFGIERSLQYFALVNLGLGLTVCASLLRMRFLVWSVAPLVAILMVALAVQPDWLRLWDTKHFAALNHDDRHQLSSADERQNLYATTDVLYYAEGVTSTISVVKVKGANQGLNVNGRTVASNARPDQQCQYTLGHLPMLLHQNPKKVWVLGMGTGMTAGATSVHPEVESVTIAELEKHVGGAARTFADYNHNVLDNPKVKVVFNDGRNHLLTTEEHFDVITADPIHPWSQGSAYLYTDEYYRLAAQRLRKGGIMCQWLPIYELSPLDLKSVVKTFANNFRYVYVWLTDYDAELIGSNDPILIDTDTLQRRIEASPEVLSDLQKVNMGSAAEFLSYCIMGPEGSRLYGHNAPLNTDDNLYLEFSAPRSRGKAEMTAINIASLSENREDLLSSLPAAALASALGTDPTDFRRAADVYDIAHLMWYQGKSSQPRYAFLMDTLENRYPWFAPGQFLVEEHQIALSRIPRLVDQTRLSLIRADGKPIEVTLSAVISRISPERAKLLLVDNQAKKIYGHIYIDGKSEELEQLVAIQSEQFLNMVDKIYRQEKISSAQPKAKATLQKIEMTFDNLQSREI